jgi:hypothetical protein
MSSVAGVDESKGDLPSSHERDRSEHAEQDSARLTKTIESLRILDRTLRYAPGNESSDSELTVLTEDVDHSVHEDGQDVS